ncbi:sensor histidine kinase [Neobacillus muris]|uniref:sensor histidine kinase n=1 Tax=Neobacillus muris TaxID=2941334 RepID=UPI00203E4A4C|nr:HAMP domain-containing sensor histidine kinase [Neobacillus muris]
MYSIYRKLSLLFITCTLAAIFLVTLFVNVTVTNKFNRYMIDIQNKRYEKIVSYFQEAYKRDGKWTEKTGIELMHEAYMGNYCITLLDQNKQPVWGMDPSDIKRQLNDESMPIKDSGVYTSKLFKIIVDEKVVGYANIGQYSSVLLSEEDVQFKSSINKSIVASGVITLIIVSILSLYFSKQFSSPIKEAANMSVRLSKGDFNIKSSKMSNIKEIEDLRRSVNDLASKLKYQDMLRKKLVSDLSHEIRTPLNVLQNNVEAMVDGIFPVTTENLQSLNEEVIRFGKLINNLNELKEFESEAAKLNFEVIFLDELITEICHDFSLAAENRGVKLSIATQPNYKYRISGDKDQLKQVFINLLSNSLKFTQPGGGVWINLFEKNKTIVVEVQDNGMGIHQEDLPYIFERLYRGDKSRNVIEGSGIGLTIVKNILQLHNAGIDVESQEGKGTKFSLYFSKDLNN